MIYKDPRKEIRHCSLFAAYERDCERIDRMREPARSKALTKCVCDLRAGLQKVYGRCGCEFPHLRRSNM
jgi:hypothetical protein